MKISKEDKRLLKVFVVTWLLGGVIFLICYGVQSFYDWTYHYDELLSEELLVGEEIEIISPSSPEGMITVKSYFAVVSENPEGQGLKVSDLFGALKENNSILQFQQDDLSIFMEDGKKFASFHRSRSYTLQVYYEEKIVEEGQTLYKILDDYYVVVPSAPQ